MINQCILPSYTFLSKDKDIAFLRVFGGLSSLDGFNDHIVKPHPLPTVWNIKRNFIISNIS